MNWSLAAYSALAWAAQPLLRRKLRRRAQAEPGYGESVGERFGRYAPADLGRDGAGHWVWVHAVSLGETRAAALLIAELRAALPGMRLLLTNGTATGRAEGRKLLQPGDLQVWQPWDSPQVVRRFLRQFRPAVGVLMETEIWPNLVAGCHQAGVPLVLANARLNPKSLAGAQRWPALFGPTYAALRAVWAQSQEDAERLRSLGAPVQAVLGNLKFDVQPDAQLLARGQAWRAASPRPVVMLASAREGE
ncbi:3-deoxy-D-manno-octulosonic acid transferase, partial [Comamonas aquatica]|uniref:3-deoxy-D-manno-octulosonic acid transferase n=1 Tax=Comamonas aquatica TaxID=225991 RepID=UPI003F99DDCA